MIQEENLFKKRALANQKQIGIWSMICSTINTELLGDAGFDWILLDCEHSPLDVQDVMAHLQAAQRSRSAIVVRPACCDQTLIKRLLDVGAETLLIPFIQTAEEARLAVSYCRYPPQGVRGVSGATRASRYGRVDGYLHRANDNIGVVVQVETMAAMQQLSDIAGVEGVDGVFIGPSDLSASFGQIGNPAHPDVQAAIRQAAVQIREKGKAAGILAPNEADAKRYLEWGYSFVAVGVDIALMSKGAEALLQRFS